MVGGRGECGDGGESVCVVHFVVGIAALVVVVFSVLVFRRGIRGLGVTYSFEISPYPSPRTLQSHLPPLDEVVRAAACEQHDARGRVALVLLEVEVQPQTNDAD